MNNYLNIEFGSTDHEIVKKVKNLGFQGIRSPIRSSKDYFVLDMAKASGMRWIFVLPFEGEIENPIIVQQGSLLFASTLEKRGMDSDLYAIEVVNEPTALSDYWKTNVKELAWQFALSIDAINEFLSKVHILSPSIHTTDAKSIFYLSELLKYTEEFGETNFDIALHRYPEYYDFSKPKEGYKSRNQEMLDLLAITKEKEIWLTETGLSQYQSKNRAFPLCMTKEYIVLPESAQVAAAKYEMEFWKQYTNNFVWYQLNDGPDTKNKEHGFGIRTIDIRWKEVAHIW